MLVPHSLGHCQWDGAGGGGGGLLGFSILGDHLEPAHTTMTREWGMSQVGTGSSKPVAVGTGKPSVFSSVEGGRW